MILLRLPLYGFEILFGLFSIWLVAPNWTHPLLGVGWALVVFLMIYRSVLYFRAEGIQRRGNLAELADGRWLAGLPPEAYRLRLYTSVQLQGWRTSSSMVNAQGRVEMVTRKDRTILALLCVPPPEAADAADLDRLAVLRSQTGASQAALVTAEPPALALPERIIAVNYDDLNSLDDTFGMNI
jgi:hypothetical protein